MKNIAVVTGASSGLGREYVKAICKMYPHINEIWAVARREEKLKELKNSVSDKIRPLVMDITDKASQENYKEMLSTNKVNVSLLINNAGFGKLGDFCDISAEDNGNMVRLNCEALTVFSAITLPFMQNGSEIINTCSIAAFAPNTRMAVYSSTKSYVMSFSAALRSELKPKNINVLAVCPGPMDTEFLSVANISKGASHTFDTLPRVSPSEMAQKSLIASKKHKCVYTNKLFYKFYRLVAKILPRALVMKMCGT